MGYGGRFFILILQSIVYARSYEKLCFLLCFLIWAQIRSRLLEPLERPSQLHRIRENLLAGISYLRLRCD